MDAQDVDRELQLLAEGAALRRLARSLVGGAADAEDLVQDTLAASLSSGNDDAGKRPWLFGTLRNLALLWRRSATRRTARERAAAAIASPRTADPSAIVAQAEAMRDVAAAVHDLEEPFRTAIVLRFWRGLMPDAIAEELGVPRNTVRSRLQRGLDKLRTRLDRAHGDRRCWLAVLSPFAKTAGIAAVAPAAAATTTWTTFGALIMTKLHIAVATAAIAAVGFLAWWLTQGANLPPSTPTDEAGFHAEAPATGTSVTSGTSSAVAPGVDTPREVRVAATPVAGLEVTGDVTRNGAPVAGLVIELQWFDGTSAAGEPASRCEVKSDTDGRFLWSGPARSAVGTVRAVRANAASDTKVWCTPQIVQPGQAEANLRVTVVALDRTLFGRVHDVGGAPIEDAELSVNGWEDVATKTDAEGRYELKVTGPPYPLLVVKNGFRERLFDAYMPEGKQRHELDVELEPGAAFSGRVVDEAGTPVAGAQVRASGLTRGTETGADGRFVFGGAARDERHELTATKAGFQRSAVVASPGDDAVEIVLRPGRLLLTRVIDTDGNGVAGARISVLSDAFRPMEIRGITDAEGRLRIEDLPSKPIDVLADKAGFVKARGQVDVPKQQGEFVLVLRPGRTIAGRVLDESGAPIVGASVYCQISSSDVMQRSVGSKATSDTDGRFTIQELPPEPCTVKAHHADYRRGSLDGISGTPGDLVIRMQAAASVAGRVVDGVTGLPIRTFTIQLLADREVQPLDYVDSVKFADSDGFWRVKHWQLEPGALLFAEAWSEGYAPQRVQVASKVDAPRDQSVIRLFVGTAVRGTIVDATNGTPVPQVEVTLQSGDPRDPTRPQSGRNASEMPVKTRVHTDGEGRFELLSVPPGEHRLLLGHAEYPARTFGPFQVAADAPSIELQPKLTHGATIRGRVTGLADPTGKKIAVHAFEAKTIEAEIAADGSFELRGVGPGRASLSLTTGKGNWHSLRVEVGDEDIADLLFALPPAGTGTIRAAVVGLQRGRGSVESIDVAAGQCKTVRTFEYTDAAFVVDALPPGRYEVEVFSLGVEGSGRAEVTVGDGAVAVTVDFVRK